MREELPSVKTPATDFLTLSSVTSGYGEVPVLKSVSLTVQRTEIFALLGKNGMGKTTLLKTILGFLKLRAGTISFDGVDVSGSSPNEMVRARVAYAPQERPLFHDLSIRDNLRLALRSDGQFDEASALVYEYFPFLRDRLSQKAGTLSGGEQKMLILARALMLRPKLVLIDEISEGLQPSVVDRIVKVLRAERDVHGTTVLIVEQNLNFALAAADRWAVLKLGEIDDEGVSESNARERILAHLTI